MKVLRDFLRFLYWDFKSPFEVKSKSYEFSKVDLESVTTLIVLRSLFGLENEVVWHIQRNWRSGEIDYPRSVFIGPNRCV